VCTSIDTETKPRVTRDETVTTVWTTWTSWGQCDGDCGPNGTSTRIRACISLLTKTQLSPDHCKGPGLEEKQCYLNCDGIIHFLL